MTMTPIRTPTTSSLADDVRAIRELPDLAGRRQIRQRAGLSLAQIGNDVGVSATAVWQWEMRVARLPFTTRTVRYARLLKELDRMSGRTETPQE